MAMEVLTALKNLTFSGFKPHSDSDSFPQVTVSENLYRVSIWGTLGSGATALVSFIFSRSLVQENGWKAIASHVFEASLTSSGTFAAVAGYMVYNDVIARQYFANHLDAKALNERVSNFAQKVAMVGFLGATAAWASNKPLEKHLYSFIGLGTAGSILWIFHNWQNKQLAIMNEKKEIRRS